MRILHAADLHIDSPMRGLTRYEGAPVDQMRGSTRLAVQELVRVAIDEGVAAVTIGGDVFDGDWPDVNTGLWWNKQLDELTSAGVEVFIVHGNHDAESMITKRLPLPGGVHVFGADRPGTVKCTDHPLAVHGQSFRDRAVTDDLAASYPAPVAGVVNVGLLHTSLDGRPGHAPYAPTSITALRAKRYDLWALGHVHLREHVQFEDTHVLFPGNTQGRHARETGPKGVSIIETDGEHVLNIRHVDVDAVRWERLTIDVTGLTGLDDLVVSTITEVTTARASAGRPLAIRLEFTGHGPAHRVMAQQGDRVRASIISELSRSERDVWLEKIVDRSRPTPVHRHELTAAMALLDDLVEQAKVDERLADELAGALTQLDRRLGPFRDRFDPDSTTAASGTSVVRHHLDAAATRLAAMLEPH